VEAQKTSDDAFFALCEYFLADPQSSARYHRTLSEKLIYLIVRYLGRIGLLLAYAVLVVRDSAVFLSCFKHVAVLDIHAKMILRREDIRAESRSVAIRRRHRPSRQIFREMATAYRRYIHLRRTTASPASDTSVAATSARAASNEMYLVWLLHFYVHRSIILANAETVKATIRTVLTLEEFTPLIAGYLSAFSDLDIPLVLYLPGKLAQPRLTVQALPLFRKVIVKSGDAADFLHAGGKEDVLLEESGFPDRGTPPRKDRSVAAVFLASFYTLSDTELTQFLSRSAIPYLRRFQQMWQPLDVRVFCHPNDARARIPLEKAGFEVSAAEPQAGDRMASLDIVLSGNTSVIDEAIAAGLPVIYCGNLDKYSYDLMGFVKEGLVLDGTHVCPPRALVEDFFRRPQTRARLQRYRQGSGSHRVVRLVDEIQAEISPDAARSAEPCATST
jgi:hypothetical protein